jgi:deoxyribonuclease (pyrimidine dimer)
MTRINCVPVSTLSDKHLLAEYREITRPFKKVSNRLEKYGISETLANLPHGDKYLLGRGHETFFFDKLEYLTKRYNKLAWELLNRGVNIDFQQYRHITMSHQSSFRNTPLWNDWEPTPEDMYLNMARLAKRCTFSSVHIELQSPD